MHEYAILAIPAAQRVRGISKVQQECQQRGGPTVSAKFYLLFVAIFLPLGPF